MTEQPIRPPVDEAIQAASPDSDAPVIEPSAAPAETIVEAGADDKPPIAEAPDQAGEAGSEAPAPKKRIAPQAVIARLVEAWPQAFFSDPRAVKPLAIGTLQQILANRPEALEGLNSQAIRTGIKFYTSRLSYHYGMVNNTHRITLSGENADEVDEKAREYAKAQIAAIRQQRAAQRAAQNPPSPEQGESGEAGEPSDRPARGKRPFKKRPVKSTDGSAEASERTTARPPRAKNERSRPKGERTGRRSPEDGAPHSSASAGSPAAEPNLTMDEKLARLAAHFGKTPS